jgi:hypothetical protein
MDFEPVGVRKPRTSSTYYYGEVWGKNQDKILTKMKKCYAF